MKRLSRSSAETRERLVQAASEVFAQAGVQGATTREIARVAGVNEVTLFRHFASKDLLLGAVVEKAIALQAELLSKQQEWTQDLHQDLTNYAEVYNRTLEQNEDLTRMFIGEAKRYPEEAKRVIQEAVQPLRQKLIAYLQNHQKRGTVREDLDLEASTDLFTGMLVAGMLRRSAGINPVNYSCQIYLKNCVDIFVTGISKQAVILSSQALK